MAMALALRAMGKEATVVTDAVPPVFQQPFPGVDGMQITTSVTVAYDAALIMECGDLSLARVYWTIIGDANERKKTTKALERAAGFVRHLLAERLALRRVPELKFIFDQSVAAQDRIEQIIQEIHAEEAARTVDSPDFVEQPADPPAEDAPKHGEPK